MICGERVLAKSASNESGAVDIVIDPQDLGPGKSVIQCLAEYADGDRVRGEPISLNVSILDHPPAIERIEASTNQAGEITLTPKILDAEKDPVDVRWFQALPSVQAVSGRIEATANSIRLIPPAEGFGIAICSNVPSERIDEIVTNFRLVQQQSAYWNQYAGLVFGFRDTRNFSFFGFYGDKCAWALGACRDGKITWKVARGDAIQPERNYVLSIRKNGPAGIECRVNDDLLIVSADQELGSGPAGVMAAAAPAEFQQPAVSPPFSPAGEFRIEGGALSVSHAPAVDGKLFVRASDGHRSTRKSVSLTAP